MASGKASRKEGSTPSGMGTPSIVKAEASPLVPGCSMSETGPAAVLSSAGAGGGGCDASAS